jgi:hypothetical protein
MSVISTAAHPKFLWPGLNAVWGSNYTDYATEWTDLFEVGSSEMAYEEDVEEPGFGLVPIKPQGKAITYMSTSQQTVTRYTHVAYGSGFIITHEEWMDNLYEKRGLSRTKRLARSFRLTKETVLANIYNRAHTSGYTGGDGVVLCSTAHPTLTGNQSNRLSTAADLSEASLEDLAIQIMGAVDSAGLIIKLTPKSLHIPKELVFEAERILKSVQQNDTANNAVNALRSTGMIPSVKANHFFTDPDAFFIRTDAPDGMKMFQREDAAFAQDGDFETGNQKYKGYERYSGGWSDFRGLYSNGGGA